MPRPQQTLFWTVQREQIAALQGSRNSGWVFCEQMRLRLLRQGLTPQLPSIAIICESFKQIQSSDDCRPVSLYDSPVGIAAH